MKTLGLILVIVGVGLSGAFGSRVGDDLAARIRVQGTLELLKTREEKAFAAYCEKLFVLGRAPRDGCPEKPTDGQAAAHSDRADRSRERLGALQAASPSLPPEPAALRRAWLDAWDARLRAEDDATRLDPAPTPSQRVKGWFSIGGIPFVAGLGLIVGGSLLVRRAIRLEAHAADHPAEGASQPAAQDFGILLEALHDEVRALAHRMDGIAEPTAEQIQEAQEAIEALRTDKMDALIDARGRVQRRFGVAGYAAIMSPLSSAERYVNRAWSALVDRHWPEARRSVNNAVLYLEETHRALDELLKAA